MPISFKKKNRWLPGMQVPDDRWNRLHRDVFTSMAFRKLDRTSKLLLLHLFTQYNGYNNGKLQATLNWLRREFNWGNSPRSLAKAIQELVVSGFIREERHWSRARSALYSLTWLDGGHK
jgi:hypothetical protein